MSRTGQSWVTFALILAVLACAKGDERATPASDATVVSADTMLIDTVVPSGPLGASINRGRALLANTRDSLPEHVRNQLRCMSCHLDEGRRRQGSWIGVYARYPQYRPRSGSVETLEFRINDCFKRSMNGKPLPDDSREMRDMVAYLAFLSRGLPVGGASSHLVPLLELIPADSARGSVIYATKCVACHGQRGEGTVVAPPVWGPNSYNIGAGMSRVRTAATFIKYNMPFDRPGSLGTQEAFDVATYINRQPRPDHRGKELDWPNGDPPPDVAYETRTAQRPR